MANRISIFIFIFGLLAFIGAESFGDFYFDIKSRFSGEPIDYSAITEFCGWTGEQFPWESEFDYRLRAAWNMFSALCAMMILAHLAVGLVIGAIFSIFYFSGGFK